MVDGRGTEAENAFAEELAARAELPSVGSSDAHDASGIGRDAIPFERPVSTVEELVTELFAGRVRPWGASQSPLSR